MSDPENNLPGKNGSTEDDKTKDTKKESENLLKILDDLLAHTNSSRRLFMIFIACALFFGPVALVLGGVLLGHPAYNIRHLESSMGDNSQNLTNQGLHIQVVTKNGTVVSEMPFPPLRPHSNAYTFLGLSVFIIISIVIAGILLFIAVKEYRFFSHWNNRFVKYKSLKDKVDKELDEG